MKAINLICLLALSMLMEMYSCSKDDKIVNPSGEKEISIDGFISNEQGNYINDVLIEFGNVSTRTNYLGYFQIPLTKYSGDVYVKASKQGYFTGSRTLFLEKSKSTHIRISLLQKSFTQSFNASSNSNLDFGGKVKIEFPANAVVTENGQVYNGNVNVAIKYLDPTDFSIRNLMPGDLVGINKTSEMQQLGSYGMAAVELQSNSGTKLQIKENTEVMLKIEIPATLRANAPTAIPLWYFDESSGLWKEQGAAVKNGNVYEGKVSHFSFWNCDISWSLVHLQGRIIDNSNHSIVNSNVKLTIAKSGLTGYGRTNNEGVFEGMVPKGEGLIIDLIDDCNSIIFSKNIGPFNVDTDLGDIQIQNNSAHLVSVEGSVVDCNNLGLANAIVLIQIGSLSYSLQTNSSGNYSNTLAYCTNNLISITAINLKTLKQSITAYYNLPGPVHVSPLQICGDTIQADEYINIVLSDGITDVLHSPIYFGIGMDSSYSIESVFDTILLKEFSLSLIGIPALGSQNSIFYFDFLKSDIIYAANNSSSDVGIIEYSKVAAKIGEYYEGTFNIINIEKENFNTGDVLGTGLTMDGSFRIKRTQ